MKIGWLASLATGAVVAALALSTTISAQEPPLEPDEIEPEESVVLDEPEPTPTPPPVTTAAPTEPFQLAGLYWRPNCGLTAINVYLRDGAGNFVNGVRVRVQAMNSPWAVNSNPTGNPGYGPGETDITLRQDQVAGKWAVWVLDAAERQISPVIVVETDTNDCRPDGNGHQIASLQFVDTRVPEPALPPQFDWLPGGVLWEPNCSVTQLKLFARGATGQPINGVRFRVSSGNWSALSNPTGIDSNRPGWTDMALRPEAFKATWEVTVVDGAGRQASDVLRVQTNTDDCGSGGSGHQVATLVWSKRT